jgi:hypothetical protein
MSRLTDLDINCAVRKILVRHWIDLGRISMRTTGGVAHLNGELARLPKVEMPLTPSTVTEMINEIRRTSGARRVEAEFINWAEHDDVWKQCASRRLDVEAELLKQSQPGVYDLTGLENQ